MKKFDRLPAEKRKEEIKAAALWLYHEKGFAATTMENIVDKVTLSKGGVYRIYASREDILEDLLMDGMHLRNAYYEKTVKERLGKGIPPDLPFLTGMIADSLLLYEDYSRVYVEFLIEKQRNVRLQQVYERIAEAGLREAGELIKACGAEEILGDFRILSKLTDFMNSAILSIQILGLKEEFKSDREIIIKAITGLLMPEENVLKEKL